MSFHFKICAFSGVKPALSRGDEDIHRRTSTCLVVRGVRVITAPSPAAACSLPSPCQAGRCAARSRAEWLSTHIEFQRGSSRVPLREIGFERRPLALAPLPSLGALLLPITALLLPPADPHFERKFSPVELVRSAPGESGGMKRH